MSQPTPDSATDALFGEDDAPFSTVMEEAKRKKKAQKSKQNTPKKKVVEIAEAPTKPVVITTQPTNQVETPNVNVFQQFIQSHDPLFDEPPPQVNNTHSSTNGQIAKPATISTNQPQPLSSSPVSSSPLSTSPSAASSAAQLLLRFPLVREPPAAFDDEDDALFNPYHVDETFLKRASQSKSSSGAATPSNNATAMAHSNQNTTVSTSSVVNSSASPASTPSPESTDAAATTSSASTTQTTSTESIHTSQSGSHRHTQHMSLEEIAELDSQSDIVVPSAAMDSSSAAFLGASSSSSALSANNPNPSLSISASFSPPSSLNALSAISESDECIFIIDAKPAEDKSGTEYVAYIVEYRPTPSMLAALHLEELNVKEDQMSYVTSLRYSEFYAFYSLLKSKFACLPEFPSKTLTRKKISADDQDDKLFVSRRKVQLEKWLRAIAKRNDIAKTNLLWRFLGMVKRKSGTVAMVPGLYANNNEANNNNTRRTSVASLSQNNNTTSSQNTHSFKHAASIKSVNESSEAVASSKDKASEVSWGDEDDDDDNDGESSQGKHAESSSQPVRKSSAEREEEEEVRMLSASATVSTSSTFLETEKTQIQFLGRNQKDQEKDKKTPQKNTKENDTKETEDSFSSSSASASSLDSSSSFFVTPSNTQVTDQNSLEQADQASVTIQPADLNDVTIDTPAKAKPVSRTVNQPSTLVSQPAPASSAPSVLYSVVPVPTLTFPSSISLDFKVHSITFSFSSFYMIDPNTLLLASSDHTTLSKVDRFFSSLFKSSKKEEVSTSTTNPSPADNMMGTVYFFRRSNNPSDAGFVQTLSLYFTESILSIDYDAQRRWLLVYDSAYTLHVFNPSPDFDFAVKILTINLNEKERGKNNNIHDWVKGSLLSEKGNRLLFVNNLNTPLSQSILNSPSTAARTLISTFNLHAHTLEHLVELNHKQHQQSIQAMLKDIEERRKYRLERPVYTPSSSMQTTPLTPEALMQSCLNAGGCRPTCVVYDDIYQRLIVGTKEKLLYVYSFRHQTPQLETVLQGHTSTVSSLAYLPTHDYLASGSADGEIILWRFFPPAAANVSSEEHVLSSEQHEQDNSQSSSSSSTVVAIPLFVLELHEVGTAVSSLTWAKTNIRPEYSFSTPPSMHDDKKEQASSSSVSTSSLVQPATYPIPTPIKLLPPSQSASTIGSKVQLPLLLSGDGDGFVIVWDVQLRTGLMSWRAHRGTIHTIECNESFTVATASEDKSAKMWQLL